MQYIIYPNLECLVKKIDACENDPEKSSSTKTGEHIICRYSMSTIWGFDHIKNKHTLYRGNNCMKKFCNSLREHAQRIVVFEKKKMSLLTSKELKSHEDGKVCQVTKIFQKYSL